jgi:hypothetical protein
MITKWSPGKTHIGPFWGGDWPGYLPTALGGERDLPQAVT